MKNFISFCFLAILIIGCTSDDENNSCGVYEGYVVLNYQKDVDEFAKCNYTSIEGSLYISDDAYIGNMGPLIRDISGLSSLTLISGDIRIKNIVGLTSLYGLHNIETCKGLDIIGCKKLINTDALQKLKLKGGGVYVMNNPSLEKLSGFHFDDNSNGGAIVVSHCPLIKNIDVFKGVTKTNGAVIIDGNSSLENIEGLRNLKIIGDKRPTFFPEILTIRYNENLVSLDPLKSVTTIDYGGVKIEYNPLITDLGFTTLTDFKGDIYINNNDNLLNIDGLSNIIEVEELRINSNKNLQNLNGLSSLVSVRRKMHLRNNKSLLDFCGIENFAINGHVCSGYDCFIISDNGYNPLRQDIIDGNCSQ